MRKLYALFLVAAVPTVALADTPSRNYNTIGLCASIKLWKPKKRTALVHLVRKRIRQVR
jgi:hypothetical protein